MIEPMSPEDRAMGWGDNLGDCQSPSAKSIAESLGITLGQPIPADAPAPYSMYGDIHVLVCRPCMGRAQWAKAMSSLSSRYAYCVGCRTLIYCEDITLRSLEAAERTGGVPRLDEGALKAIVAKARDLRKRTYLDHGFAIPY